MKILFDVGNTRIKAASYDKGVLTVLPSCSNRDREFPLAWSAGNKPSSIFVASVAAGEVLSALAAWAQKHWGIAIAEVAVRQDVGDMRTAYEKPSQLGVDRWLAALGAYHLAGKKGVCVIDAGTALTVDVVDQHGLHHGGLIAPGLNLMIESLTRGTAQLELENISVPDIFANNTESAISLGCADYVAGMVNRVATRIETSNLKIDSWFITGGQGELVASLCSMPMELVPDLVLRGMIAATESEQ
jgi:type III pantothenate kinase